MLTVELIRRLFHALNDELARKQVIGEIGLCGGAVMCLVFQTRKATKDVDAIFKPTREIRDAAKAFSRAFDVPEDWLNDAAKGYFFSEPPRVPVLNLCHLRVWPPCPHYRLAMKCFSARFDSHDRDDVTFLIQHLKLTRAQQVFDILKKYCPERLVPPKTRFLVEELLPGEQAPSPRRTSEGALQISLWTRYFERISGCMNVREFRGYGILRFYTRKAP